VDVKMNRRHWIELKWTCNSRHISHARAAFIRRRHSLRPRFTQSIPAISFLLTPAASSASFSAYAVGLALKRSRIWGEASHLHLARRERQIVEALYRLGGEASVADVRAALADPPGYSAVRAVLNLLVRKGLATTRHQGKRYLYRALAPKHKVRQSALRGLVQTFFGSTPLDAVAALIDGSAGKLSADDLRRLRQMIDDAEQSTTSTKG
jgi:BlaI family penicillinase repressor